MDARRRCHCKKTLTPSDEASVRDASTHTARHSAQHTRACTPAKHTLSEHAQGPSAHARRVPSDGHLTDTGHLARYTRTCSCAAMHAKRREGGACHACKHAGQCRAGIRHEAPGTATMRCRLHPVACRCRGAARASRARSCCAQEGGGRLAPSLNGQHQRRNTAKRNNSATRHLNDTTATAVLYPITPWALAPITLAPAGPRCIISGDEMCALLRGQCARVRYS